MKLKKRDKEKKIIEEIDKKDWVPQRTDVLDVITEVNQAKASADPNKPTDEMCGAKDLLEYLYAKNFAPFEIDERGIPDPTKIVKPYKRSTGANIEQPCDYRTEEALADSMIFLLNIMDNKQYDNISIDEKFIYVSDRIRAIHTDIIHQQYVSSLIFDIAHAAIMFYSFYSFQINCDNYDFAKEQLKQWILTLKHLYEHIDSIMNEEEINEILEREQYDEMERVLLLSPLQRSEIINEENSEMLIESFRVADALEKMEYGKLKKIIDSVFPVSLESIVFHALFRMRLIDMRHRVLSSWAGVMQLPIPVSYVVDALMYDDEEECIADLISCGLEVKEDKTFLAKKFDLRDCKRIPRNISKKTLNQIIKDKEKECGDMPWSEVFFGEEEDESYEEDK
ncbi:hypothetical protein ENUP19_0185G0005 [Entamoeba nuttalli]|uniref:SAC3/GANP/THP3 conserved domain-containing protein n=2 Tax=Entamoeba nuttalli TaxID=412467 RepID=K2GPW8_ENTNP|nr:hypothetical protein ENU1_213300 [Entamoeba nuttalli P19]EKE36978.1 hypothetical protein ENU1_213300 [Entamoeba nuttalli P19]|eukprot:XP_008860687.1 hypothetical protein ENU1_213300 [Entamoeba nuttalli P19]